MVIYENNIQAFDSVTALSSYQFDLATLTIPAKSTVSTISLGR